MTYYYLASPYSAFSGGLTAAYEMACKEAAHLVRAGIPVFSPIAAMHGIALHGWLDPFNHNVWLKQDAPMMASARGIVMLLAPSWENSRGMAFEHDAFVAARKPVFWMFPGTVPTALVADARRAGVLLTYGTARAA